MRSERFEFLRGRAEVMYERDKKAGVESDYVWVMAAEDQEHCQVN